MDLLRLAEDNVGLVSKAIAKDIVMVPIPNHWTEELGNVAVVDVAPEGDKPIYRIYPRDSSYTTFAHVYSTKEDAERIAKILERRGQE